MPSNSVDLRLYGYHLPRLSHSKPAKIESFAFEVFEQQSFESFFNTLLEALQEAQVVRISAG